jgi:hypothetical protein
LLKRLSFLQHMFLAALWKNRWLKLIFASSTLFHCLHIFLLPVSWCFCYYVSLLPFEVRYYDTSSIVFFFLRISLVIHDLLCLLWTLRLTFLFLRKVALEFIWGLHQINRLLSIVYPVTQS